MMRLVLVWLALGVVGCLPPGQTLLPDKADFAFVQIHLHG